MNDSVAQLRSRWTPESTAAAIRFLQGLPVEASPPTVEFGGKVQFDLRGIRIEQTQLDGALLKNVNLRWSTFRDVGFKGTRLLKCNLSQASFAECYFRRARFERCDAINAKFESCDFSNARIESSRLDFATFKTCEITLPEIAFRPDTNPQVLVRVCRNLKLNAMSMGHFADAGELTFMEKTYERQALFQRAFGAKSEARDGGASAAAAWLGSLLLNWIWGYGEKPWRMVLAITLAIFAFGTLQYALGAVPDSGWWGHVYFSGITFLTIGYGDLSPVGALPRFLAVLEGAAGIATLGMLIASATKKIMYR
jgi:hypothetical protein